MSDKRWTMRTIRAALGAVNTLMSTDFDNGKAKWPEGVATSDMMEAQQMLQALSDRHSPKDAEGTQWVLRIQSTDDEKGARWIERYFLRDQKGRYKELKRIPGNGQYAPGTDEILKWFEKLGVTHVEVVEGWHETVPAKTYPLKIFARHMRRVSKESQ